MRSYNSGNAYKYDNYYHEGIHKKSEYENGKFPSRYTKNNLKYVKKAEREKIKNRAYIQAKKIEKIIAVTFRVTAVFLVTGILVYRYILIDELKLTANKLKSEYENIVAENQALQNNIDSAIDLKKLQEIATTRLGMIRPDSDQIFYVESDNNNYGEKIDNKKTEKEKGTEADNQSGITGVTGSIVKSVTGK